MKQTIVMAADHAGFKLKAGLKAFLQKQGYKIMDLNPGFKADDDYPLVAQAAARAIKGQTNVRAILLCGSGAGIAMAANRFTWMRVAQASDAGVVKMSRTDEDANGLSLAARRLTLAQAKKLVSIFLATPAATAARHRRRQKQLARLK